MACCILHNFLIDEDRDTRLEEEVLQEVLHEQSEDVQHNVINQREDNTREEKLRNTISTWGLTPQSFPSLTSWKVWLEGVHLRKQIKEVLEGVFFVTWWSIWMFRNNLLFGSCLPSKSVIFNKIVSQSYMWCANRFTKKIDWVIWHQNPSLSFM